MKKIILTIVFILLAGNLFGFGFRDLVGSWEVSGGVFPGYDEDIILSLYADGFYVIESNGRETPIRDWNVSMGELVFVIKTPSKYMNIAMSYHFLSEDAIEIGNSKIVIVREGTDRLEIAAIEEK